MSEVSPIPEGYNTVSAFMVVKNANEALEFYSKALGAEIFCILPTPDGNGVMHAEMKIGNSIVMLSEENPQWDCKSAITLGGSPISLHLYVEDADAAFQRALDAGCEVTLPMMDAFWGDRFGKVKDKFGMEWSFATHVEDVPLEEMPERAAKAMAEMNAGGCN